jgi:hypothetical protein
MVMIGSPPCAIPRELTHAVGLWSPRQPSRRHAALSGLIRRTLRYQQHDMRYASDETRGMRSRPDRRTIESEVSSRRLCVRRVGEPRIDLHDGVCTSSLDVVGYPTKAPPARLSISTYHGAPAIRCVWASSAAATDSVLDRCVAPASTVVSDPALRPFEWKFTRHDLAWLTKKLTAQEALN